MMTRFPIPESVRLHESRQFWRKNTVRRIELKRTHRLGDCCPVLTLVLAFTVIACSWSVSIGQDNINSTASGTSDDSGSEINPGSGSETNPTKPMESFLGWMIRASGIFGFLIMLVSFVMVSIIMMIGLQLRRDNYLPGSFVEEFEQRLQSKDYQGAYESARQNDSFIGRVLTAGMERLSRGYEEAEAGLMEVAEDETMAMEHKIGYLSLIGSIAPMLGLLGTVQGMVLSFQVIATSITSPKPSDLADGIATALFTTLEGLVVAIPAIIFYTLYRNRLSRFLMESGFVATNLMKNFQGIGKPSGTKFAGDSTQ